MTNKDSNITASIITKTPITRHFNKDNNLTVRKSRKEVIIKERLPIIELRIKNRKLKMVKKTPTREMSIKQECRQFWDLQHNIKEFMKYYLEFVTLPNSEYFKENPHFGQITTPNYVLKYTLTIFQKNHDK